MKKEFFVICVLGLAGCGSAPHNGLKQGRFVLDNSSRGGELPTWVTSGQVAWEQGDSMFFKSTYTVSANQRVNGCYDLAKLELKESLLSELSQDIKGELNLGSEGISEGLDPLVTKSIRTNIEGTVKGLRMREQLYERYVVADVERVDCYVQALMAKTDYNKLKNSVLKQMASVSEDVAVAMRKRQQNFFKDDSQKSIETRKPGASESRPTKAETPERIEKTEKLERVQKAEMTDQKEE